MNTNFIDVSEIAAKQAGAYISQIAAADHPMLIFMPNLDYAGMDEAENLAKKLNIKIVVLPITLPIMDLIKQIEYAGMRISQMFVRGLESEIRRSVVIQLEKLLLEGGEMT